MCLLMILYTFGDRLYIRIRQFTIHLITAPGIRLLRSLLEWESRWASSGVVVGAGVVVGVAAISTSTATTISIEIPTSAVATALTRLEAAIAAILGATAATSAAVIVLTLWARGTSGNTIHLIEVGPRTGIEIQLTGSVEPRAATHWRIDNEVPGIKLEGKVAASAAQRVPVEQAVSAASVMEAISVSAAMSLIAVVSGPAIALGVEVSAIAEASEVVTALATAA